jgi:hypothetical protein
MQISDGTRSAARCTFRRMLRQRVERVFTLFGERARARGRVRLRLQSRLLAELAQWWTIEEQLLLPALDGLHGGAQREALCELKLLRDQAMLVESSPDQSAELALAVLQGIAELHFAHVDDLLQSEVAAGICWPSIESQTHAMFERWSREQLQHGQIEDEDRDPVGLEPR